MHIHVYNVFLPKQDMLGIKFWEILIILEHIRVQEFTAWQISVCYQPAWNCRYLSNISQTV